MRPLRVYVDTSVLGGMFDSEFKTATAWFFRMAAAGRFLLVVSEQVEAEIRPAPRAVRKLFDDVLLQAEFCRFSADVHELTNIYVQNNVVGVKSAVDAAHVALATVSRCDGLVSWNFKHIVNPDKSARFNVVNAAAGYPQLFILSPKELMDYGKI